MENYIGGCLVEEFDFKLLVSRGYLVAMVESLYLI